MPKKEQYANQREAVILRILVSGEKYGLQIRNEFRKLAGRELPLGSLYPTLEGMIDKGFVRAEYGDSEHAHGGNRRRYYRITAAGHRALDAAEIIAAAILGGVQA